MIVAKDMILILLPWPPKELSLNGRLHWSVKAKAAKSAREAAGWATKVSGVKVDGDENIDLHITFYPPDRRKRDMDGMLSSLKASLDGIADGLNVDDCRFRLHLEIEDPVKGGQVSVLVKPK